MSNRYTHAEITQSQYYQFPKFLMSGVFNSLSNDAKVLYMLLRDRHDLSLKNKWINDKNEVYIIFTRDEMGNMLGKSENTVRSALKQLSKYRLIEEERQGLQKPNLLYLCKPDECDDNAEGQPEKTDAEPEEKYDELAADSAPSSRPSKTAALDLQNLRVKTLKNCGSRSSETAAPDPQNLRPSKTDISKTDCSETDNKNNTDVHDERTGADDDQTEKLSLSLTDNLFSEYCNRGPTKGDYTLVRGYLSDVGTDQDEPPDISGLLEYSFERSVKHGCPGNWDYIGGVMKKLKERGIKTQGAAAEYDQSRESTKSAKRKSNGRKEVKGIVPNRKDYERAKRFLEELKAQP